jgi:hypothetical protein
MKKKLTLVGVIGVCVCLTGCATPSQARAIRWAANAGTIQGMDTNTVFAVSFPSDHSGPYSSVDDFNVTINKGTYKGKQVSFILGRSRETGEWEVLRTLVNENGKWKAIPITEKN